MRREFWRRPKPSRTVYVGSHEDKLSRIPGWHIDPDDDGMTREDRHADRSVFADSVLEPGGYAALAARPTAGATRQVERH